MNTVQLPCSLACHLGPNLRASPSPTPVQLPATPLFPPATLFTPTIGSESNQSIFITVLYCNLYSSCGKVAAASDWLRCTVPDFTIKAFDYLVTRSLPLFYGVLAADRECTSHAQSPQSSLDHGLAALPREPKRRSCALSRADIPHQHPWATFSSGGQAQIPFLTPAGSAAWASRTQPPIEHLHLTTH